MRPTRARGATGLTHKAAALSIRLRCQSATDTAHETRMVEDRRTVGEFHGERRLTT
jgi:hypothetical protein